ncbi:MAG: universal stress protein [Dehalococcoidia bacterium]|nr:universal stress protein [Dehalococcoidia bacterium]
MFDTIIVCLDGSPLAEQILPYAAEQARRFGSKVILFRVITATDAVLVPTTPTGEPLTMASQVSPELIDRETKEANDYLCKAAIPLEEIGLKPEIVTLFDPLPGAAIVDYANQHQVDLIAIATHGRSGFKRAVFGSVADYVLRESHLPVLLISPREEKS